MVIRLICVSGPAKWKPPSGQVHITNLNLSQPILTGKPCQGNLNTPVTTLQPSFS